MDPALRNAESLHEHVSKLTRRLIERYEAILIAASIEETDPASTANAEMKIQEETAGLVRAAEDLMTLIRQMQELWLFGSLDTLTSSADHKAALDQALELATHIQTLSHQQEDLGLEQSGEGTAMREGMAVQEAQSSSQEDLISGMANAALDGSTDSSVVQTPSSGVSEVVLLLSGMGLGPEDVPLPSSPPIGAADVPLPSSSPVSAEDLPLPPSSEDEAENIPLPSSSEPGAEDVPLPSSSTVAASDIPLPPSPENDAENIPLPSGSELGGAEDVPLSSSSTVAASDIPLPPSSEISATDVPLPSSSEISTRDVPFPSSSDTGAEHVPLPPSSESSSSSSEAHPVQAASARHDSTASISSMLSLVSLSNPPSSPSEAQPVQTASARRNSTASIASMLSHVSLSQQVATEEASSSSDDLDSGTETQRVNKVS